MECHHRSTCRVELHGAVVPNSGCLENPFILGSGNSGGSQYERIRWRSVCNFLTYHKERQDTSRAGVPSTLHAGAVLCTSKSRNTWYFPPGDTSKRWGKLHILQFSKSTNLVSTSFLCYNRISPTDQIYPHWMCNTERLRQNVRSKQHLSNDSH